jgi:hypothetical protein
MLFDDIDEEFILQSLLISKIYPSIQFEHLSTETTQSEQ